MKKPEENIATLYGLKSPKINFKNQSDLPHHEQIVGVEIESENCKDAFDYSISVNKWSITTDNSLRGQAYEFISFPAHAGNIINFIKELYEVNEFTERNFTDRCSIHVHANVLDFTVDELSCLALYYQTIEQVLFEFVGHSRDTNLYCIPWTQCLMNHQLINGLYSDGVGTLKQWQKYTALNLLPILKQGTVEFRHMHGTADIEKIRTWINIISHLMYKAKNSVLEKALEDITSLNDSSLYSQYFDSIFNGYLPYNEVYRQALIEGVIHAKYSLIGFDVAKKPTKIPVKRRVATTIQEVNADLTLDEELARVRDRIALNGVNQTRADAAALAAVRERASARLEQEIAANHINLPGLRWENATGYLINPDVITTTRT